MCFGKFEHSAEAMVGLLTLLLVLVRWLLRDGVDSAACGCPRWASEVWSLG